MLVVNNKILNLAEVILTSPGSIHEVSTILIDGRLQRVYKNLWSSLRQFWLSAVSRYAEDTYVVYEHQRWTFQEIHHRALKLASLFSSVYDIGKGDYSSTTLNRSTWLK